MNHKTYNRWYKEMFLMGKKLGFSLGSYGSWKTWKVLEFCNFQVWKVIKFEYGLWKVMENDGNFFRGTEEQEIP